MKLQCNSYIEKIQKQCMSYARKHYRYCNNRNDIEVEDIAQEMLQIIWQSYRNRNGVTELIKNQKLLPSWQLKLVFLNALRNLNLALSHKEQHPNPGKVIRDEDGNEDFWMPAEEPEPELPLRGKEKEQWLREIQRLKKIGYSDDEIVQMLRPVAEKTRNGSVIPEPPEQGELFNG